MTTTPPNTPSNIPPTTPPNSAILHEHPHYTLWTLALLICGSLVPNATGIAAAIYLFTTLTAHGDGLNWVPAGGIAVVGYLVVAIVWHLVLSALRARFPRWWDDDERLRHDIKAMTDEQIRAEENHWSLVKTRHSPGFGEDRDPQCDVRSPSRCEHRLRAERFLYGLQTERRLRGDLARREARASWTDHAPGPTTEQAPDATPDPAPDPIPAQPDGTRDEPGLTPPTST